MLIAIPQSPIFAFTGSHVTLVQPTTGSKLLPRATLPARLDNAPLPVNSSIPSANYDEQLGFTFTQNFTNLSYNVTAVEQQDIYGYGPAYLLNGLSNLGYWFQVGLSWDWPLSTGGHSSGFAFNYEVFAPNGTSIYPVNAGGLENFSGPVKAGDQVDLSLSFSSIDVILQAVDWDTGAVASADYNSSGATYFVGLPHSISNYRGFFTGLMTEQYHVSLYNGSETKVTYSSNANISSAWMWVDEFNANTSELAFLHSTVTPITYTAQVKLQYFFYEGSTLISNGYEFITGTTGSVLLTVSFLSIGGSPPLPPRLVYSFNGSIVSTPIAESPTTYLVDNGSTWSVANILSSLSSSGERWTTPETTSGVAGADQTIKIVYYHQYLEEISYTILGGGANFESPELTFINYGRPNSVILGTSSLGIWVDVGTQWNATNILAGSGTLQRWVSNSSSGLFSAQENLILPYYHENLVAVGYSVIGGGGGYSSPELQATVLNSSVRQVLSADAANLWLNVGAPWQVNPTLSGTNESQRWITLTPHGVVTEDEILPVYYHQSLVALSYGVLGNASGFVPPFVNLASFGALHSFLLNSSRSIWIDYGTVYSFPDEINGSTGERWIATSQVNVTISSQSAVRAEYQTQYLVDIVQPRDGGGRIFSVPSGWYDQSQNISLTSESDPGWKLDAWAGTGEGSYSGNSSAATLSVNSPIFETAIFYPAFTIVAGPGGKVTYSFDGNSGAVSDGKNVTIYVAPLTEISLVATSQTSLNLFTNWHGALDYPSSSLLLQVRAPESISASFGFNYPLVLVSSGAIIGVALLIALSLYRRRNQT